MQACTLLLALINSSAHLHPIFTLQRLAAFGSEAVSGFG